MNPERTDDSNLTQKQWRVREKPEPSLFIELLIASTGIGMLFFALVVGTIFVRWLGKQAGLWG